MLPKYIKEIDGIEFMNLLSNGVNFEEEDIKEIHNMDFFINNNKLKKFITNLNYDEITFVDGTSLSINRCVLSGDKFIIEVFKLQDDYYLVHIELDITLGKINVSNILKFKEFYFYKDRYYLLDQLDSLYDLLDYIGEIDKKEIYE